MSALTGQRHPHDRGGHRDEGLVEVNGTALYVTDTAARSATPGPPLLLLHGWGADRRDWDRLAESLSDRHRVLTLDLRGHGRSPASPTSYSPFVLAADVAELLRARLAEPAVLVGHSLGALVVSIVAVEHPATVAALLVVDPAYGRPAGHEGVVAPWVARLRAGDGDLAVALVADSVDPDRAPDLVAWLRSRVRATAPEVIWRTLADIHLGPDSISTEPATRRYLANRACPVLALNRQADRAALEVSFLRGPLSRSLVWPDSGHFPHLEHPARFERLVREWLSIVEGHGAGAFSFASDVVGAPEPPR
ncbi:alpha/beta fold hydrolase [Goodfellowiella coeruleoviolacea]|uniref:Pimeloyl-ACP methyl ester carboxylesterase n=1 Tax=Goodfellowiella coeruleoviolacea TaxID=334858 RepID=A0AAE3GGF9_9PSEU|nr:alpha/beta hydrolase [Goodfellowiella coeruleoviolacea]MCP2167801.1 Pimeloyl-ACP methyl ester carboxylesterase [Goodfellowiella coeruleoviolacea]